MEFYPLSSGFVLAKPLQQESYDESIIYELERNNRLIITRKRDGWKIYVVKSKNRIALYTDGINEIDDRLLHIKKELERLNFPDETLFVGEGIVEVNKHDIFIKVQSVLNSGLNHSQAVQKEIGFLKLMLFDVIFLGGKCLLNEPYEQRLLLIEKLWREKGFKHVIPIETLKISYDDAKKLVEKKGWEGLVLYDKLFVSSFRLDGKSPTRPTGCYKWKPLYEDDFIVRKFILSSNDPSRLKEVILLQIDPENGKEFYCGKLGAFNKEMREKLFRATYPLVVQVRFETRFESGAVRNARFMRLRKDKSLKNCIAPKHFPKARHV